MATFATAPPPRTACAQAQARPRGKSAVTPLPALAPIQRVSWVAPWGSDQARGTRDAPFATIDHARQQVQALLPRMTGDVVIVLRGGRYTLADTLTLGSADSGRNGYRVRYVAYPGEAPVVCAGVPITGWRQESAPPGGWLWSAPLPAVFAALPQPAPRQMWVNDVRAVRVRAAWPSGGGVLTQTTSGYSGLNPLNGWRNPGDIEFVYRITYQEQRARVAAQSAGAITMADTDAVPWTAIRTMFGPGSLPAGPPTFVEHAKELLRSTTVGQFWVDTLAGRVYYVPRSNEIMSAARVVAPALEALTTLRGVSAVSLEGLTFAEASWLGVNHSGLAEVGGNQYFADGAALAGYLAGGDLGLAITQLPAALQARACTDLLVSGCTFVRLGGAGIGLGPAVGTAPSYHTDECPDCTLAQCTFSDLSAGAIVVRSSDAVATHVRGCTAHDCGLEYSGGGGISLGLGAGSTVAHNHVGQMPYHGLDVYQTGLVEDNDVQDAMQVLVDGGAIYSYGPASGLTFRRNRVGLTRSLWPGGALYSDGGGASNKTWQNNVVTVLPTSTPAFFSNPSVGSIVVSYNWSDTARATVSSGVGPLAMNRVSAAGAPAPASVVWGAGPGPAPAARCTAPGLPLVSAADPPSAMVTLAWTAPAGGAVSFYEVWADDLIVGTTTGLSFVFADLAPGRTYVFTIRAADASGGVSAPSAPLIYSAPPDTLGRATYGTGWE